MRVHLVKEKTIEEFIVEHSDGKYAFRMWLSLLKTADWTTPDDLLKTFSSADLLGMVRNVLFLILQATITG